MKTQTLTLRLDLATLTYIREQAARENLSPMNWARRRLLLAITERALQDHKTAIEPSSPGRRRVAVPYPQKMSAEDYADFEKAMDEISESILDGWIKDDVPVIEALHPDAIAIVPLYRSALVIEQQTEGEEKRGAVRAYIYHDPGWMGEDVTPESMTQHRWEILFNGQRDGPDVYHRPNCRCGDIARHLRELPTKEPLIGLRMGAPS